MDAQTLSIAALWGATALYTISLVGYSIRLARVADARGTGAQDPAPKKALGIARATVFVGAALHLVGVVARAVESGHVPWTTMYEYTISGSLVAVLTFLIVQRLRNATYLGAGVTGIAVLALGLALPLLYREATPLQPALQHFWLIIHVSIATMATGILAVGFAATLLQLLCDYRDSGSVRLAKKPWGFLAAVPTPQKLEALAFRLHAIGFVLWTFTVISGAIWANDAWGRAWGWDPKEVWSFVVWVIYAAYLHARTTRGWTGRRAAYLATAGFVALVFNFTVVNLLIQGLHSYAGV